MSKSRFAAAAAVVAFSCPALAQDAELAKIRAEIRQLKEAYEQRIEALEKRLAESEARTAERADPGGSGSASSARTESAAASAFNPAVALILQGTYAHTSRDPN